MAFSAVQETFGELGQFHNPAERCRISIFKQTSHGRVGVEDERQTPALWITSRSAKTYKDFFSKVHLVDEVGPQFIEAGAGLGGFLPDLVHRRELHPPPIVIDPIDYAWVHAQLEAVLGLDAVQLLGEEIKREIQEVIERCVFYRSSLVRHIRLPLHEALRQYGKSLKEKGDAIIDVYGGGTYEEVDRVNDLPSITNICRLVKPDGRLYSSHANAREFLEEWRGDKGYYLSLVESAEQIRVAKRENKKTQTSLLPSGGG